jgi:hypothetical protein
MHSGDSASNHSIDEDTAEITFKPQVSDESDNEVNFDLEPIELEEIGVTSKVILEKSHKKAKDVELKNLKGEISLFCHLSSFPASFVTF